MKRKPLAGEVSGRKRINTKKVSSKYIGETEKNLNRVFSKTKPTKPTLLLDEADSLLGKRSKVKDSHDRYTND